ncbi:PaaI family thioesterase [Sphingomonas sp. 28-63-12]|uniref:PaaI family thioesterase n=1 Tax=Sphingomonas sp. 28-63-12 TaxID=1970434 RepID=UPI000BC696FE|nr:MAG: phenylacetic acid degradation protein [Sphingomonas sp. 28-63-12]
MTETSTPPFRYTDAPGHPGWMRWELADSTRFNSLFGPFLIKVEDRIARVRMTPGHLHSNLSNAVHGGALLGFVDMALFAASRGFGLIEAGTAVTLDLSTQFIGRAVVDVPVEAQVELLRETGRLLFLRGLVVQGEGDSAETILAFAGTIRKPSQKTGAGS